MYLPKIAITVIIIAVLLFIGLSVYSATNSGRIHQYPTGNDGQLTSNEVNDERSLRLTNIKTISSKSISSDIVVIPYDEKDLKVVLSGKVQFSTSGAPNLIIEEHQDEINIEVKYKENKTFNMFNFSGFNDLKLFVYLPESYSNNMEFTTTSGDIDTGAFETLKLDAITCHSVSGNFLAESIDTSEMAIKTTSGDLRINSFAGDLEWNSISGNLSVHYKDFDNDIKANTISGNIHLGLPSNSAFEIDFSTLSGSVSIGDFPVYITTQKRTHFQGSVKSNNNKINVHTTSGNLKIAYTSSD